LNSKFIAVIEEPRKTHMLAVAYYDTKCNP
jgi:hypothetical protein